jgi:hypothetical protein
MVTSGEDKEIQLCKLTVPSAALLIRHKTPCLYSVLHCGEQGLVDF